MSTKGYNDCMNALKQGVFDMGDTNNDVWLDIQRMRTRAIRRAICGAAMLMSLLLLQLALFFLQDAVSAQVIIVIMVNHLITGMAGIFLLVYYGTGWIMLLHNMKELALLAPPSPVLVGRRAVLRKGPVYGVGGMADFLMFVGFCDSRELQGGKTRLPRVVPIWQYSHVIGGLRVTRREGFYSVPTAEGRHVTGDGVLYGLLSFTLGRISIPIVHTREQLDAVVSALAAEVTSYGAGRLQ
ncbi:MAG: hypothetical protein HXY34_10025 [Candidatus Thorarchaeota archaeon]|nr:hypothetical protein [Candidatus Thorarchaeota archaeon]